MLDELLVDHQDFIRNRLRRRALSIAAFLSTMPISWCYQQRLLQDDRFIRRGVEIWVLAWLSRYFRANRHASPYLMRKLPAVGSPRRGFATTPRLYRSLVSKGRLATIVEKSERSTS